MLEELPEDQATTACLIPFSFTTLTTCHILQCSSEFLIDALRGGQLHLQPDSNPRVRQRIAREEIEALLGREITIEDIARAHAATAARRESNRRHYEKRRARKGRAGRKASRATSAAASRAPKVQA
jgi:hypothetical protein